MPEKLFATVKTHPAFERGWNRLQLTIEIGVAIVIGAGLLGAFGTGPLSSARQAGPSYEITYERLLRRTLQTELKIRLLKPVGSPTFEVLVPNDFLAALAIVSASPRPGAMRVEPQGIAYIFDIGRAGTGEIGFELKPKGYGAVTSPFVLGGEPAVLRQFIYP